jgi:hypothetical protein
MYRMLATLMFLPWLTVAAVTTATGDWSAVEALATQDRIQVTLFNGNSITGTVDHVTSVALYVTRHKDTTEVRREDVRRVEKKKSGHALRWALVGAAAGAGAGGGIGAATMEKEPGRAGAIGGTVGLCALIGAGIGYFAGHGHSTVIYEAARPGD